MAISIRSVGTPVYGTANLTPTINTAQAVGDMMICFYGTKPYSDAPTINQGWASLGSATDGTILPTAADVGSMQARIFWKIATADPETDPLITNSTNNVSTAVIIVFQKGASDSWATPLGAGGGDATAGTDFSVTASSDVGHTTGDMVVGFACFRSDGATPTTARSISITGCGLGSYVQAPATDPETTSGYDMGLSGGYLPVNSGTSSAAPVYNMTLGAAHTGSAYLARLRVTAGQAYVKFGNDTETVSEVNPRRMAKTRIKSETEGLTEVLLKARSLCRRISETTGISEGLIKARNLGRAISETLGINEGITRARALARTISETVSTTEVIVRDLITAGLLKIINETESIVESVLRARVLRRWINETINAAETIVSTLPLLPNAILKIINETIGIVEGLRHRFDRILRIITNLVRNRELSIMPSIVSSLNLSSRLTRELVIRGDWGYSLGLSTRLKRDLRLTGSFGRQ